MIKPFSWGLGLIDRLTGREAAKQFVKFSLVGTVNTCLDLGVYLALTRLTGFWSEHLVGASVVSFCMAVVSSFILNTFWTFRRGGPGWHRRAGLFFMIALGGLLVNATVLWVLITLSIWDIIAKLVATVFTLVWNFTMQRRWTFGIKGRRKGLDRPI